MISFQNFILFFLTYQYFILYICNLRNIINYNCVVMARKKTLKWVLIMGGLVVLGAKFSHKILPLINKYTGKKTEEKVED